jgi:transcriptional regulator with XRE-family HTH domain
MTQQDRHDVLYAWGDRLRAARTARSLSRGDLAQQLGVVPKTIQRWESGDTRPSEEQQRLAAEKLGISVSKLFPRTTDEDELPDLVAALGNGCS